jgi:hypothetical protein
MGTRCRKQNTGGAIHEIQSEPENSLFRRMNSLFRKKDSLFRKEQGISRRRFKSLCDFASDIAETALNKPNFAKIPVNFPVIRESAASGVKDARDGHK